MDFMMRFVKHVDEKAWNDKMVAFMEENCHIIDLGTEEHSIECYETFERYQVEVEEMMEDFVSREEELDCNADFCKKLRRCCQDNSFAQEYVDFMMTIVSFESFAESLRGYWRDFARKNDLSVDGQITSESKCSKK